MNIDFIDGMIMPIITAACLCICADYETASEFKTANADVQICKKNHIPVRYVIGYNRDTCHAWNRVKIGKKWYWIDCTMSRYLSRKLWDGYSVMESW